MDKRLEDYVDVHLTPEETAQADHIALLRRQAALQHKRNHDGHFRGWDADLSKERLGARCEMAAKKWLDPVSWVSFVEGERIGHQPDLADFIDVKGTRYAEAGKGNLILRPRSWDHREWAYLHVVGEYHPHYVITGWCWGYEGMTLPYYNRISGNWEIPPKHLRGPDGLIEIVRERQANGGT